MFFYIVYYIKEKSLWLPTVSRIHWQFSLPVCGRAFSGPRHVMDVAKAGLRPRTLSAAFIKHKEITSCCPEDLGLPYVKKFLFEGKIKLHHTLVYEFYGAYPSKTFIMFSVDTATFKVQNVINLQLPMSIITDFILKSHKIKELPKKLVDYFSLIILTY